MLSRYLPLPHYLNVDIIRAMCQQAIAEDVGPGDATSIAIVPPDQTTSAFFITRKECVVAGLPVLDILFRELSADVEFTPFVHDGDLVQPGQRIASITGNARAILTGERTALNLLQRLSGIATITRRYVEALGDTNTKLLDTRKTTPGLRLFEKYAVLMGGGQNHRIGLYDRVMIKDNHRALARLSGPNSIQRAVQACREKFPSLEIEVEADSLADVRSAAEAGVEYILLDNMSNETMLEAIRIIDGRAKTEASGNITLERLPSLRDLGLDYISSGALTHSAPAVDIGLDILN
ncbi:MAG: carboxylating nicotinate-nucleotide diphosphorylase [Victivallales bacterium]|nr:carboxylating nicotinate-nucleotide diphosphorylase [Victivallales bacterium]